MYMCARLGVFVHVKLGNLRQTPEEGRRTYPPKRCRNNNKGEGNSPKTLNNNEKKGNAYKIALL